MEPESGKELLRWVEGLMKLLKSDQPAAELATSRL